MANTQTFTGDGTTTVFNFTFPFFGINDIHASINNVELSSTDFTITPNPTPDDADIQYTGGTINFTTAPANGTTIKLWRHVELNRHIDYQPTLQPQSYQLNQDLNQCIEILKEQSETLTNVISLANIPNVAELLAELSGIRDRLDTFITTTDFTTLSDTVAGHTTSINTLNGYDYVVESQLPTADNNYTWYRKYKSGWVEMGGLNNSGTTRPSTITLPIEMSDANYTITMADCMSNTYMNAYATWIYNITSTGFTYYINGGGTGGNAGYKLSWRVAGIAAN